MILVIIAVGLLFAAAAVFLVMRMRAGVAEQARVRATTLAIVFALMVAAALTVSMYAQVYYRLPVAMLVVLVGVWIAVLTVALALASALGRTVRTLAAIAGLFVTAAVATLAFAMVSPLGAPTALIETRAAQIAEENGFVALLSDDPMITGYVPVDTTEDGGGLRVEYQGFVIEERPATQPLGVDELRALVAPGEQPLGLAEVSRDASVTVFDVNGRPAVGATFLWAPPEAAIKGLTLENRVSVLVLEIDGVDVRIESASGEVYTGPGEQYEYRRALTPEELAAVAERLAPVE